MSSGVPARPLVRLFCADSVLSTRVRRLVTWPRAQRSADLGGDRFSLSLGLLFWCFFCLRRKRLIENVPTSKVKRDYFAAHGFERAVPNTET